MAAKVVPNDDDHTSTSSSNTSLIRVKFRQDELQLKLDLIVLQYPDSKTVKNEVFKWISVDCGENRFRVEGEFRLIQSLVNLFDIKDNDDLECVQADFNALYGLFQGHIQRCRNLNTKSGSSLEYEHTLLNLIGPLLSAPDASFQHEATQHRNLCILLHNQINLSEASDLFQEHVTNYLARLLNHSEQFDVSSLALKMLKQIKGSCFNVKIMVGLDKLASYFDINNTSRLYERPNELKRFVVGFEARWLIDNVISSKSKLTNAVQSIVKLSKDRLIVQGQSAVLASDENNNNMITTGHNSAISSVRSSFPVNSGTYYYECIILSGRFMSIGWCSKESELGQWRQLGIDQHSIGFDGFHQCFWHSGKCCFTKDLTVPWKSGDVIGCLVDVEKQCFKFYLNGVQIECSLENVHFSSQPYFAAASLTKEQMCCFNFGQVPFKYAPQNVNVQIFHQNSTNLDPCKYYLLEPLVINQIYWFKEKSNELELFFQDSQQLDYDQMIIDLEKNTSSNSVRYQSHLKKLETRFISLIEHEQGLLRTAQSILTRMGQSITGKKIDWIRWLALDHITRNQQYKQYEPIGDWCEATATTAPSVAKFLEFIHPHLSDQNDDQIKHRNICLVLSLFAPRYESLGQLLTDEILSFLVNAIFECDNKNKSSLLFALITLTTMDLSAKESFSQQVLTELTSESLLEKLKKLSSYMKRARSLNPYTLDFIQFQIALCAFSIRERILTFLLDCNELSLSSFDELDIVRAQKTEILSAQNASGGFELSPDQLSARSDKGWQSGLAAFDVPPSDVYYYEVVLLTSGPMRIGWASELLLDLDLVPIGSDSGGESIGFDGYRRSIAFDGKEYAVHKNGSTRWKIGDVVGCSLDLAGKKLAFYLNGREIKLPHSFAVFCDSAPDVSYYPAISLATQQQCYCNFGQKPFRYAPE